MFHLALGAIGGLKRQLLHAREHIIGRAQGGFFALVAVQGHLQAADVVVLPLQLAIQALNGRGLVGRIAGREHLLALCHL